MISRLHKARSQDGSITLLALAFLGFVVVPLMAILWWTSQATTAYQVARGAAFSSAYSGLSRSLDIDETLVASQPQLFTVGSPELAQAEAENTQAVDYMWRFSGIQGALPGATATAEDLPDWGGYTRQAGISTPPGAIGVVNVSRSPDDAFSAAHAGVTSGSKVCSSGQGFKSIASGGLGSSVVCWVDHRALDFSGNNTRNSVSQDSWDHYSSGVETRVRLEVPSLVRGTTVFEPLLRSSATFAQPCLGTNCSQ